MAPSWFKLLIILLLVVVLFGRGRIAGAMGDFARGIKNFRRELGNGNGEQNVGHTRSVETPTGEASKNPPTKNE